METVLLCAVGVGGATAIGSLFGFLFRSAAERHSSAITSFAAGVMLAAAMRSLIAPAFDGNDAPGILLALLGLFAGAVCLYATERYIPLPGCEVDSVRSAVLFAIAMAIHNLPEGVAAGLGFGTGSTGDAIVVALGIALHNIPEGMIAVFPLISSGIKPHKAFLLALSGGAAEVVGTFIGYFAAEVAEPVLPFALAFAGGTMLYVVASEMIPESQVDGKRRAAFFLIFGYALLLVLGKTIGA